MPEAMLGTSYVFLLTLALVLALPLDIVSFSLLGVGNRVNVATFAVSLFRFEIE